MKILQINSVCGIGSTGRIAVDIHNISKVHGYQSKIAFGRKKAHNVAIEDTIKIGSDFDFITHALSAIITDKTGFYSKNATSSFIRKIDEYDPDIIHLHNIHGYYVNVSLLFEYLSGRKKKVIWTLHDCWSFTGHCAYFDYVGCEKWRENCGNCPQKLSYPPSIAFDNSLLNYRTKKELFTSVGDLTLVTPSEWLASIARESFLGKYPIEVVNNGINLPIFINTKSNVQKKFDLCNKIVILGVANIWDYRKGLHTFIKLADMLDERYQIILIGLSLKQIKVLPKNIIGITRTNSMRELAEFYSAADVFVNPTLEEVFGLVNIEALACGTPVITYETGGSVECIDETCGIVVEKGNVNALAHAICEFPKLKLESDSCRKRALLYDNEIKYLEYIDLYKRSVYENY